ncbi:MAG: lipoyl(octanoyl) transferase LipB [Alphaproteobacteria bacterium]
MMYRNDDLVPYAQALEQMDKDVTAIASGHSDDILWLSQHPPVYTAGTSARMAHHGTTINGIPLYPVGRGGQVTYHGPGQVVGYVMLDLHRYRQDVRWFVETLECWIMNTLAAFGVSAVQREGRTGLWVPIRPDYDKKIAAIGVRLRRWVTFHGVCVNVTNDLTPYQNIVPCGITHHGVTRLSNLRDGVSVQDVAHVMRQCFLTTLQNRL